MKRRYWLLTTVAFLCATTFLCPGGARVTEAAAIVRIADVNRLKLISRISAREGTNLRLVAPGKMFFGKVVSNSRVSETAKQTVIENDFFP
jgi:hypothetical protein